MNLNFQDISVIAVDLIDTLVRRDVASFSREATDYLSKCGFGISSAEFYALFRQRYLEYSIGNYEDDEEFFRVMLAEFPGIGIDEAKQHLTELIFSSSRPFSDSRTFLAAASCRYRLVLSSNHVEAWARRLVQDNSWDGYFSQMLISSQCHFRKPARRFFRRLIDVAGVESPGEILVVGDSLINDVVGAQRCGLRAIHLSRADEEPVRSHSDINKVRSLAELARLMGL